jgi:translocator protein
MARMNVSKLISFALRGRARDRGAARGAIVGATAGAAIIGRASMRRSDDAWYEGLRKPRFAPSKRFFRPAGPALYALLAMSALRLLDERRSPRRRAALGLWGASMVLNAAWYPLVYRRRNLKAGLVGALALAGTTTAYAAVARPLDRTAAFLVLPYLGWLGYVGAVNAELVRRNP